MKRYEYTTTTTGMNVELQESADMNDMGFDGWELVSVNQVGVGLVYYWKRESKGQRKKEDTRLKITE